MSATERLKTNSEAICEGLVQAGDTTLARQVARDLADALAEIGELREIVVNACAVPDLSPRCWEDDNALGALFDKAEEINDAR